MSGKLMKFIDLVASGSFRTGLDVPKAWNEKFREALSEGLVSHARGGRLIITEKARQMRTSKIGAKS